MYDLGEHGSLAQFPETLSRPCPVGWSQSFPPLPESVAFRLARSVVGGAQTEPAQAHWLRVADERAAQVRVLL